MQFPIALTTPAYCYSISMENSTLINRHRVEEFFTFTFKFYSNRLAFESLPKYKNPNDLFDLSTNEIDFVVFSRHRTIANYLCAVNVAIIRLMHMRQIATSHSTLGPFTAHSLTASVSGRDEPRPANQPNQRTKTMISCVCRAVPDRNCVCVHVDVSQQSTHISIIIRLIYPRKQTIL